MKREKGKKYDGRSRPTNEAYKNGWNEIFLNKVLREEVEIGATGTQKYRIKHGPNKNKVVSTKKAITTKIKLIGWQKFSLISSCVSEKEGSKITIVKLEKNT